MYHSIVAGMSLHVRTRWSMSFTTAKEDIVKIDVGVWRLEVLDHYAMPFVNVGYGVVLERPRYLGNG